MKVTYYKKEKPSKKNSLIATFGVYLPEWHMRINNLLVFKGRNSGWYITMPYYKDRESGNSQKGVAFDPDVQQRFLKAARAAIEEYATKEQDEQKPNGRSAESSKT